MTTVKLPPWHHIKSRMVSDYTFSEHAEGWDDCLAAVMARLTLAGIQFDEPLPITVAQSMDYE